MVKNIEEVIIRKLEHGPVEKRQLIEEIAKELLVTIQAVYKILRKLFAEETVIQKEHMLSLSLVWVEEGIQRFNTIAQSYNALSRPYAFLALRDGESIQLRFKTLKALDLFWTEAFLMLEKDLPGTTPAYSISPHDWFYALRPKTDALWLKKQKRSQRLIITHPAALDCLTVKKRSFTRFEVMVNANPLKQEEYEYKNILGPWLFEVKLDQQVNKILVENINKGTLNEEILTKPGVFKLKITRSNKKTSFLLKKVERFF